MHKTLTKLRILALTFCALLGLLAVPAPAQSFPISTNFFGAVTWTNATGNRLQMVRVVLSLSGAAVNTGRIYTLSSTSTNLVADKADSTFRAMLWPSATSTVYIYHGDRIRATVSTTNRAYLTIDALPVDANVITNITESDPVWIATKTGGTDIAIGASADAGAGGAAYGWQATGYNQGAAFGVLADAAGGQAAAFGRSANANNSGAAVGYGALGANSGVAVGYTAKGRYAGVGIGYGAIGTNWGVAVGYGAYAPGFGNVALGGSDTTNVPYVPGTFTDTVAIGRGRAVSNGWMHFRGKPVIDPSGNVYSPGGSPYGIFSGVTVGSSNYPASIVLHPGTGMTIEASSTGPVFHASATGGGGTLTNAVGSGLLYLGVNGSDVTGGIASAVATGGQWNAGLDAVGIVASGSVQRTGDTMTGPLTNVAGVYIETETGTNTVIVFGHENADINGNYVWDSIDSFVRDPQPDEFSALVAKNYSDNWYELRSNTVVLGIGGPIYLPPYSTGVADYNVAFVKGSMVRQGSMTTNGFFGNASGLTNVLGVGPANGFWNQNAQTISFDTNTRAITITPVGATFRVTHGGTTVDYGTTTSTGAVNTSGMLYYYWDASGNLLATPTVWKITNGTAQIAAVYWDAVRTNATLILDERHGALEISDGLHDYLHATVGSVFESGGGLLHNALATGAGNASGSNTVIAMQSMTWRDEDIRSSGLGVGSSAESTNTAGQFAILWKDSGAVWHREAQTNFWPFMWSNNTPLYVNAAGAQTLVTEDQFFCYWLVAYAAPDASTNSFVLIPHPVAYASIAEADTGATVASLVTALGSLPAQELLICYKLTFQFGAAGAGSMPVGIKSTALRKVDDFRFVSSGALMSGASSSGSSGFPLQDNANLNGFALTNGAFKGDGSGLTNLSVTAGASVTTSVFTACDWYGFRRDTTNDNVGAAVGTTLDVLTATNRESYWAWVCNSSGTVQNGHALGTVVVPLGHGATTTTNLALWLKDGQSATNVVITVLADVWGTVVVTQSVATTRTKYLIPWTGAMTNLLPGDRLDLDIDVSTVSTNANNLRTTGVDRTVRFER